MGKSEETRYIFIIRYIVVINIKHLMKLNIIHLWFGYLSKPFKLRGTQITDYLDIYFFILYEKTEFNNCFILQCITREQHSCITKQLNIKCGITAA